MLKTYLLPVFIFCIAIWLTIALPAQDREPLRLGLVGLDTSHVIAFTAMLNNPNHPEYVPGARVVAGFKGGSPDLPSSADRLEGYTQQLQNEFGVEIVDSIPALCEKVDGVLITSVDGRPKLEQARQVIAAGKPMFIDKPVAGTFEEVLEIARLAKAANVPWFGGSSLRWYSGVREAIDPQTVGDILGCDAYSPCSLEPHHPDLFWYGVHGVEILYAAMGRGCQTVQRASSKGMDVVVGVWEDGRIGTFRGTRTGKQDYGAIVFGTKAITTAQGHSYKGLVEQIVRFMQTKEPPMDPAEIVEMYAFMQAADESKRQGGIPVPMPEFTLD
ncbi:MAG: Gfo/Idh/MocA family protein [Candidatus Zipacnadales bacterium]